MENVLKGKIFKKKWKIIVYIKKNKHTTKKSQNTIRVPPYKTTNLFLFIYYQIEKRNLSFPFLPSNSFPLVSNVLTNFSKFHFNAWTRLLWTREYMSKTTNFEDRYDRLMPSRITKSKIYAASILKANCGEKSRKEIVSPHLTIY